jgi:regulator of sirC expression with transglutaminase-like and TPR domain
MFRPLPFYTNSTLRLPRLMAVALVFVGALYYEKAPLSASDAQQLVAQLDDDSFEVRRRAQRQLLELGEPALPAVRAAADSPSAEVRARAREIARTIEHDSLLRAFYRLSLADDADLDVVQGLILTSRIIDPAAEGDKAASVLDALAERVRKRLPGAPKDVEPRVAVDALCQVLFVEEGFDGNRGDYDNPVNSSITHVLATKRGLPILLSQVVIAVGRRVELPLTGLALPGRFMVKYHDEAHPAAENGLDLIIDPFEQGKVLTRAELRELLPDQSVNGPEFERLLEPADQRMTLIRVLNNLWNSYLGQDDFRRMAEVNEYREALLRDAASDTEE